MHNDGTCAVSKSRAARVVSCSGTGILPRMPRYASGTSVTVDRSITQIRQLVLRFGADKFAVATGRKTATVAFAYKGRPVKFDLSLPDQDDPIMHDIVMPDGRTVGQKLLPVVQEAISRGDVGAQLLLTNS
jgi:hypothetical protein